MKKKLKNIQHLSIALLILLSQKYLLEKRAVSNADGGTLLNEDNDLRSVSLSFIRIIWNLSDLRKNIFALDAGFQIFIGELYVHHFTGA